MSSTEVSDCAPCKSRGVSATSVKYCIICREQLCKECVECHKSFKVTKNHPLTHALYTNDSHNGENISPICAHHPKKVTEFYCDTHEVFLCSHCLYCSDTHKYCPKVLEVEDAGRYFLERNVTEKIKESSIQLARSAESAVKEIMQGNRYTGESLQHLRCEIEKVRKKMLEAFDRQTNHIIGSISKDILQNRSNCEHAMLNFEKFSKGMTENDIFLKTAIEDEDTAGVFRGAVSMIEQYDHFNREVDWTKTHCSRLKIKTEKSELVEMLETDQSPLFICEIETAKLALPDISSNNFEKMFKTMTSTIPANVIVNNQENEQSLKDINCKRSRKGMKDTGPMSSPRNVLNATNRVKDDKTSKTKLLNDDIDLSYSSCVDIKMPEGDEIPSYNGIVCLQDERIVLSDYKMSRLIMVKNNAYVSNKYIEFKPGNLALFNQLVLVCLMKTNRLLMMKISGNDLKEYRYLPTRSPPVYVQAVGNESILVSSKNRRDEWSLEIKTLKGHNWQSDEINVDIDGYQEGYRLAVQPFPALSCGYRILLSSDESKSLKCLSKNGKVEVFCSDIADTTAVLTDHLGYVFVIRYPGEVQVLTPDGHHVTSLFRRNTMYGVKFAALNSSSDKLFAVTKKDAKIHVIDVARQTST